MRVVKLERADFRGQRQAVLARLFHRCALPDYGTYNLDAFYDLLSDLREPLYIYFAADLKRLSLNLIRDGIDGEENPSMMQRILSVLFEAAVDYGSYRDLLLEQGETFDQLFRREYRRLERELLHGRDANDQQEESRRAAVLTSPHPEFTAKFAFPIPKSSEVDGDPRRPLQLIFVC
ncbi:MAG: hypothetical protein Q4P72_02245 [Eubacteriales bacterium]|nr:hypothetical protein [Eubacteriales bacterium]